MSKTLHSNLVIFKFGIWAKLDSRYKNFTFQSGYIQIKEEIIKMMDAETLYIPIWLYSNGK